MCVCVRAYVLSCVRACVYVCFRAFVRARARARVCVCVCVGILLLNIYIKRSSWGHGTISQVFQGKPLVTYNKPAVLSRSDKASAGP